MAEEGALTSDERAAMRAFLQRCDVRLSTMHRVATALLSGAGILVLLPAVERDTVLQVIVNVIDFGTAGGKYLYIVMEYIDGQPIDAWCQAQGLNTVQRLRLFLQVARAVARNNLFKCAVFGSDPNWGRVLHAVGYSRARIREELVDICYDGKPACLGGLQAPTPMDELREIAAKQGGRQGYDRRCRHLTPSEVQEKEKAGLPSVLRLKVPLNGL